MLLVVLMVLLLLVVLLPLRLVWPTGPDLILVPKFQYLVCESSDHACGRAWVTQRAPVSVCRTSVEWAGPMTTLPGLQAACFHAAACALGCRAHDTHIPVEPSPGFVSKVG